MENSLVYQKTQVRVNSFIRSVYNWMSLGLGITAASSLFVASSPTLLKLIFGNMIIFFGLVIAEIGLVMYLAARIHKIEASTATGFFILYAVLNGATLASIFIIYTSSSVVGAFLTCALTFLACSVYGMTTKKDLTSMGSFMMMGLFGIIIASLVNIFLKSSAMSAIISYIGVVIFIGLTAYDTQKLKQMAISQPDDLDSGTLRKGALLGALTLYLDFINLFLMLLRVMGSSRE